MSWSAAGRLLSGARRSIRQTRLEITLLYRAVSMGIRFYCPNGHRLHVKEFQAGKRGICPHCDARFRIPPASEIPGDVRNYARTSRVPRRL